MRKGGLEVYGGFIAATLGVLGYMIFWKHSARWYLDILAPSAALGMGLGRVGCLLNGCCWGLTCELPWAVRFPFGSPASVEQWQDGRLNMPKELLWFSPGGAFADGRPASMLPREMLRLSDEELARAKSALEKVAKQSADLAARRHQASSASEKAQLDREESRLQAHMAGQSPYAETLLAMQSSGLTLAQLKALAHQHPSLPVHPTQLYSAVTLVLLALMLNALYWRRTRDGQVICTMLLIEPWTRYVLETLRADNPTDTYAHTVSQFLAVILTIVGLAGLLWLYYLPPRSSRARLWEPPAESQTPSPDLKNRVAKA
jgi:phosphatidylglycerol:prolipoprotein diacylglycerol transferase